MRNGHKVVLAYLAFFYLLPMVGNRVLAAGLDTSYYKVLPLTAMAVALLAGSYLVYLLIEIGRVRVVPRLPMRRVRALLLRIGRWYLRYRLWVAIAAFGTSVAFFAAGLNGYRYATEGISQSFSAVLAIALATSVVVTADAFYFIFVRQPFRAGRRRRYLEDVLMALTLIVSANGTASMLLGLIALGCALLPRISHRFLFVPRRRWSMMRAARLTGAGVAVVVTFVIAWLAGETIKRSSNGVPLTAALAVSEAARISAQESFESLGYYLVYGTSSYYYSVLFTADTPRRVLVPNGRPNILVPLRSLAFRVDYLLGSPFGVGRPDPGSFSRLNYLLLVAGEPAAREGTSPGLVASFAYLLPCPFSIVACAVYMRWLAKSVDLLVPRRRRTLSVIGVLLLLLFVLGAFQSPLDMLILIDNSVLYLLLLLAIVIAHTTPRRVPRPEVPAPLPMPLPEGAR